MIIFDLNKKFFILFFFSALNYNLPFEYFLTEAQ